MTNIDNINNINNIIANLSVQKTSRKATLNDLIEIDIIQTTNLNNSVREDKVKSYRMQKEYGEKKFIKP